MHLQLWSWNYAPEPTAMGPIAAHWAETLAARGHFVEVVTAHPHYPPDLWPQRFRPLREHQNGVSILRLPLWIGHGTTFARIREEATYAFSLSAAASFLRKPDAVVAVSPSFLSLLPIMASGWVRRRPWILWLQDILPDAAATIGLVRNSVALSAARALESAAYGSAARIVVISETFAVNLRNKGVPSEMLERIYNPATLAPLPRDGFASAGEFRIIYMGNIGYSQGLVDFVTAFQAASSASRMKLVITGAGELARAVRDAIQTDRVELLGLVESERLRDELGRAAVGLVSQRSDIVEFNVPSKLMNLMASGLPVLAHVARGSETARLVSESGGGWVVEPGDSEAVASVLSTIAASPEEVAARGEAAAKYADAHFSPEHFADRFEELLARVVADWTLRRRRT